MKTAVISFTEQGNKLNNEICKALNADSYKSVKNIMSAMPELFRKYRALIFIGSAGIAVRSIANLIVSKDTDPAVLVCDELGRYVIPILSGHIGGANELAVRLANKINADAVITTATDINGIWSVDSWASKNGFSIINKENIKHISSALLKSEPVGIDCDFRIEGKLPDNVHFGSHESGFAISPFIKKTFKNTLNIVPKCVSIGVGCKKNAEKEQLINLFNSLGISCKAVKFLSTINIKKDETAILSFSEYLGVPVNTYSSDELNSLDGEFTSSDFVKKITGTDSVCERAAMMTGDKLAVRKKSGNGVTMAVSISDITINFGE